MQKTTTRKGGRRKLEKQEKKEICLKIYVNEAENTQINAEFKNSGFRSRSDYLKRRLLSKTVVNTAEIIEELDKHGAEIGKIGSNINQITKYANRLTLQGIRDINVIQEFNSLFNMYLDKRKDLTNAYRAIIRCLK